jgi:dolichyl-phosphate beta-glucosyltransferase
MGGPKKRDQLKVNDYYERSNKSVKFLLAIPNFNDATRLKPFLAELMKVLPDSFEIILSDDGSSETEREALIRCIAYARSNGPLSGPKLLDPIFTLKNQGKGAAIMRAWDQAGPDVDAVAFADADGAVCPAEILRSAHFFATAAIDALFANRVKMLGRTVERSLKRHLAGRIFATLVSNIGGVTAYDTQCGLKILSADAYKKMRPYLKTAGFAFDVELCMLLVKFGFRLIEFPVDWRDVPGSKVSLLRDSWSMALEVFRIRSRIDSIPSF